MPFVRVAPGPAPRSLGVEAVEGQAPPARFRPVGITRLVAANITRPMRETTAPTEMRASVLMTPPAMATAIPPRNAHLTVGPVHAAPSQYRSSCRPYGSERQSAGIGGGGGLTAGGAALGVAVGVGVAFRAGVLDSAFGRLASSDQHNQPDDQDDRNEQDNQEQPIRTLRHVSSDSSAVLHRGRGRYLGGSEAFRRPLGRPRGGTRGAGLAEGVRGRRSTEVPTGLVVSTATCHLPDTSVGGPVAVGSSMSGLRPKPVCRPTRSGPGTTFATPRSSGVNVLAWHRPVAA